MVVEKRQSRPWIVLDELSSLVELWLPELAADRPQVPGCQTCAGSVHPAQERRGGGAASSSPLDDPLGREFEVLGSAPLADFHVDAVMRCG
ncbi:hypothetical protein AB0454_38735 [Streptomyces sp. NPDC093509]|uniref:hypothetical protein n=1 Tax=Streptomyces sp. NPDC093509 TaxID=3154982 RepID=UPI003450D093